MLHFAKQIVREVFSSSPPTLTHEGSPTQLHTGLGKLYPHVYLYSRVGWLTHAQLYKLTLLLITLTAKSK